MDLRRAAASVLLIVVAGCSAAATAPPSIGPTVTLPSGAATSAASAAATRTPSPTVPLGPSVGLTLDRSAPMVDSDDGPEGRHWVLPAAAARDRDGGFVLFIVWFGDEAGDQVVTVATSSDGRAWDVGTEPILTDLGMDLVDPGAIPAAALQLADGTWRLYGWGIHAPAPNRITTWRASAPSPNGPWSLDEDVVLDTGPAGSWDGEMAAVGSVQPTGDGYGLWYEGEGIGSSVRGDIGFATSADGRAWQKAELPAIPRGHCGAATALAVEQPQVEAWSGGFVGAFGVVGAGEQDMSVMGLTSVDGATWSCASDEPMLRTADIPGSQGIHTIASVPLDDGRFELVIESIVGGRSELWSATVEAAA